MNTSPADAIGVVADQSALDRMRSQLKSADTTAIAANKVDSMFASMLIKSLRQTLGEEGLFPGDKSDALGGIFDQYLGDEIARGGGLGVGRMMAAYTEHAE